MEAVRGMPAELLEPNWQLRVSELREQRWDVVVAGAGPAGAMCAIHLARAGRRVLLLDQARFPRDKTCGEGLVADAIDSLGRVGLLETVRECAHAVHETSVFSPSGIEFRIPAECLTLQRRVLDALVAREAVRSGAVFHHGNVAGARAEPDGSCRVQIEGAMRPIIARVLVVATGASIHFSRHVGVITRPQASAVGARCYIRSQFEIERTIGAYLRCITPGYGWIIPMGGGLYNVGILLFADYRRQRLTNVRKAFDRFVGTFELARRLKSEGEVVSPMRVGTLRCGLAGSRLHGVGNVLSVGEAAGATLPLFGEGVGKAMRTGRIAAEVVAAAFDANDLSGLEEYPRRVERELRSIYRYFKAAERMLAAAWFNDFISWRTSRSPYLQQMLSRLIDGHVGPGEVFSARAALRSFWK